MEITIKGRVQTGDKPVEIVLENSDILGLLEAKADSLGFIRQEFNGVENYFPLLCEVKSTANKF